MIYKMAILSLANPNIEYTINNNTDILLSKTPQNTENLIKVKNADTELIPQIRNVGGNTMLTLKGNQLTAGFYDIFQDNSDYKGAMALNFDRTESYLDYYDEEALQNDYLQENVSFIKGNIET